MIYAMRFIIAAIFSLGLVAHAAEPAKAPDKTSPRTSAAKTADGIRALQWEDLVPAGYRPDQIFKKFAERAGKLKDDDPRAAELQQELMTAWSEAPVVQALDGKQIKLPGYVIPLELDGKQTSEFLLVPYFGACIHVPPPPSNQIVYVKPVKGVTAKSRALYDTVMITGILRTKGHATALAAAGYTIEATKVESY